MQLNGNVEHLVRKRQQWLGAALVGVFLWMGATVLRDALGIPPGARGGGAGFLLTLVYLAGGAVWGVALVRIVHLCWRMRSDRRLAGALSDELVRQNRYKAALVGFSVLFGAQGLAMGLLSFVPGLVSALVLAEANLLIGICAFVGAFLYLDTRQ